MISEAQFKGLPSRHTATSPYAKGLPPVDADAALARVRRDHDPGPREIELVGYVENYYDIFQRHRFEFDRVWYLNIAMYLGYQYHQWFNHSTKLLAPEVPAHRVRLVCNHIYSIVQSRIANITKSRPQINILPGTTDDDEAFRARACEKLLKAIDQEQSLDQDRILLAAWLALCGNGYWKVYVDSSGGELIEQPEMDITTQTMPDGFVRNLSVVKTDEDGDPIIKRFFTGEVANEVISPFEIYPEPGPHLWKDVHRFVHARAVPVASARLRWPHLASLIRPSKDWTLSNFFQSRISGLTGLGLNAHSTQNDGEYNSHTMVVELHEGPSPEYPKGRIITVVDGMLADEQVENPYGRFNIVHFIDSVCPGRLLGETPITHVVPVQKGYNRGRSQIKEAKNQMGKPKWTAPKNHGMKRVNLNGEAGEVIEYNINVKGMKPETVTPPPLPEYIFRDQESDLHDMEIIGGIGEVSRGANPASVKSGLQLSYLTELDQTKYAPIITWYEAGLAQVAHLQLVAAKMTYAEPRLKQIIGENGEHEIFEFTRDDIPDNFGVRVQVGSALPFSKAARQDFVLNLWDKGLITDENGMPDPQRAMQLLEFGDWQKFLEERQLDIKGAQMEHAALKSGDEARLMKVRIEVWDNHAVHISEHNRFRKSDWYRRLNPDDPLRVFFDDHVSRHVATMAQQIFNSQAFNTPPPEGMPKQDPNVQGGGKEGGGKTQHKEQREEAEGGQSGGAAPDPSAGMPEEGSE